MVSKRITKSEWMVNGVMWALMEQTRAQGVQWTHGESKLTICLEQLGGILRLYFDIRFVINFRKSIGFQIKEWKFRQSLKKYKI